MKWGWAGLLCACLAGVASAAPAPEPSDAEERTPEQATRQLLRHPALRGARVGVSIVDLASGQPLYEREPRRLMVPASNLKLLVGAAALHQWGPTHRFETPVLVESGPDANGVIDGPLWIVGSGDPSLVSESLWKLAEEIRLLGVREILGGIAVDGSHFDRLRTHPDWEPLTRRAYEAPTSAFAVNYSSFRIEVSGSIEAGGKARLQTAPRVSYFRTQSDALTLPTGDVMELELGRLPDGTGERVVVRGVFPFGDEPRTFWRSVELPELYAASVLRAQLESQGVRVRGPIRFGPAPAGARELLRFEGKPLARIVQLLNKWSNNFVAEQLTKLLGAERDGGPARWETGRLALADYLAGIGVGRDQAVISDGSGLSARNRISPAALVAVLRAGATDPASGPEFLASLPLGGLDGTLEDRMQEVTQPFRGKTGHLRHVSSLTGILPGVDGRALVFSVLVNGARGGPLDVDAALDAFVASLLRVPPAPPPSRDAAHPAEAEGQSASGD
ncbi:MAG: D-alanyl-D-alanine carboxypeptidase/D-alanyl-D-alanine-endopeptidase [Deltaproteobacteria bacterium]|nr:D-alanyl-D-alanine carboxypeptidase/D-alanyl-D-alanine-endopeptidase [Deltaproteobacteria bacterium]MBW2414357.1 D-alanyl-D-alanine carboxypeptidase/D-alanyl-D-alanine-endopeptidase [Deltaproteobacteria bacterium]